MGQPAPDGNDYFSSFGAEPAINTSGDVAFTAQFRHTAGGTADRSGI